MFVAHRMLLLEKLNYHLLTIILDASNDPGGAGGGLRNALWMQPCGAGGTCNFFEMANVCKYQNKLNACHCPTEMSGHLRQTSGFES